MDDLYLKRFYKRFPTDHACTMYLEQLRWRRGRLCPYCHSADSYIYKDSPLYKCKQCRKQFTVKVGTVFAGSHISLQEWFLAIHLLTLQKEGMSSTLLAEYIETTQKTAWLMIGRLRTALSQPVNTAVRHRPYKIDASFDDAMQSIVSTAKLR